MNDEENNQAELDEQQQMNIYQRIHAIMSELKYIRKGDKQVNGQYSFAGHDEVTARCHEMLVKYRVVINPTVTSFEQETNRTAVFLQLTFINIDNPSDTMITQSFGYGVDNQDKGPGKAISYAYKYGLLKVFALETGDDAEKFDIDYITPLAAAIKEHKETIDFIQLSLASGNMSAASEAWSELSQDEKISIWVAPTKGGPFTTEERNTMKSSEFRLSHTVNLNEED
tara:strand:- start:1312 stop:1992 length:681 start_codon:yes stop_codon:yes gene_type:complete